MTFEEDGFQERVLTLGSEAFAFLATSESIKFLCYSKEPFHDG